MASEAGKGSGRRPAEVSAEVVASNWDLIFGKKNKTFGLTEKEIDTEIKRFSAPIPEREYTMQWVADPEKKDG